MLGLSKSMHGMGVQCIYDCNHIIYNFPSALPPLPAADDDINAHGELPSHVLYWPMVRHMEPIGHDTGLVGHLEVRTVDN